MVECKVNIVEVFDLDQFPGWCKAILTDENGVEHTSGAYFRGQASSVWIGRGGSKGPSS